MSKKLVSLHMISKEIDSFIVDRLSRKRAKNTILFYRQQLNGFLEWCSVNRLVTIESLTPMVIREFFISIERTHDNGGTHAYYRAIKAFLLWWENEEEPENWKNPIRKITPPSVKHDPIQGITKDEFRRILAVCDNCHFLRYPEFYQRRDKAILSFLYDTGVRVTELCNILISDVDFPTGIVRVRITKNSRERYVFMGATCRKEIVRYLRKKEYELDDYLFTQHNGESLDREAVGDICEKYARMAGVASNPSPHDYRRAWFHNTKKHKVDDTTTARVGGHSNTSLIPLYNYQDVKDLQEAIGDSSPLDNLK